jgi:predicted deacylase
VRQDGLLLSRVVLLQEVEPGEPLGEVRDTRGHVLETVVAPGSGRVVVARRTARVRAGDGAYLLAPEAPASR